MDRAAVIDVGTNSVLLLAGQRESGAEIKYTLERSKLTRLGQGLSPGGELSPLASERTAKAISHMADEARAEGIAEVRAVGTMGLRSARDSQEFIERVARECGVRIQVISGEEEARLTWTGVVTGLPVEARRLIVFDPGGGSTEFIWGSPAQREGRFSLDVGVVGLTERYNLAEPGPEQHLTKAQDELRREMSQPLGGIERNPAPASDRVAPEALVAVGGTATTLAAVHHGLEVYDPALVHGTTFHRSQIESLLGDLAAQTVVERAAQRGMEPRRADLIPAGGALLLVVMELLGFQELVVSDRGLRHGLLSEILYSENK